MTHWRTLFLSVIVVALLMVVSELQAQELTLFTMPPPRSLNWASPWTLAFDAAVGNRFTFTHIKHKHTFGHVFIELKGPNGERELTGSTTAPDAPSDSDKVTKEGYGLGVFWADLKGALETPESLDPQILDRYKSGRIGFITFKLHPKTYQRLSTFLREYRARGYGNIYNGMNKPREGLGAGCSIFGVVFLDLAGLLLPEFEREWVVSVKVPESLIGGPLTGKKISLKNAILSRWAKEGEKYRVLSLYDPDLIFKWILKEWEKGKFDQVHGASSADRGYLSRKQLVRRQKALGLYLDVSDIAPPTDPIWQGQAATQ